MTDAIGSLVPVAFERYAIVRLQAGIFSNNPASMRVLEKCGFTREAVHRNAIIKNGVILDEVMYVHFRAIKKVLRKCEFPEFARQVRLWLFICKSKTLLLRNTLRTGALIPDPGSPIRVVLYTFFCDSLPNARTCSDRD